MSESKTENQSWEQREPTLKDCDPEVWGILNRERFRQFTNLEMIASENFTSRAVMQTNGTSLTNKYSEGRPKKRYYGGNQFIDQMELLCEQRALKAFGLDPKEWGVNVQPYSGSTANLAAFVAMLNPNDRMMGLDLPSGGHLTHGFYIGKKKISCTSKFFQSLPYKVNQKTGLLDMDELEKLARLFCPSVIVAGASAYPRDWDYARFRKLCDELGALLMVDMAHIAGLVAGGVVNNPFEHAHVVTTTTHKTLRGPRAGMIFYRLDEKLKLRSRVNSAVFPGCQGGPHNNTIGAIAVQLREVGTPAWKQYSKAVIANCQSLAKGLQQRGFKLATDGTDNHLLLWDLRPLKLTGSKLEYLCEEVGISVNKNRIAGDQSASSPMGLRLGSAALTSRGLEEKDFDTVAEFCARAAQLAVEIQKNMKGKMLDTFKKATHGSEEVWKLRVDVAKFASKFHMPGFNPTEVDQSCLDDEDTKIFQQLNQEDN